MNITPLLDELFAMTYKGILPGLERTLQLCAFVDNPEQRLAVIHVAGTNGKGSTCSMLGAILRSAGYRVGIYTSPHIRFFNERITIDGTPISNEDVARYVQPLIDEGKRIDASFFEITTVMAFEYFAHKRVDVAIIETGLGGRWDSTNVVNPLVSIITSIDLDHTAYLGLTLPSIAREKAGIIKDRTPAIIGERRQELRTVFDTAGKENTAPVIYATDVTQVEVDQIHPNLSMTVSVIAPEFSGYYTTDLCGEHQARNIATIFAALPWIRQTYFIDEDHIRHGLSKVCALTGLTGRTQVIDTDPITILDVAHNPAGINALHHTLAAAGYVNNSWNVVFGAMADKDVENMVAALKPLVKALHACSPAIERSAPAQQITDIARTCGIEYITTHPSVAHAVKAAKANGPTLICGSFHVADEALADS